MLQLDSQPDYAYSNSLYVIKLVNRLSVYPRDPSPHGMISPLVSLLNFSHRGELPSLEMISWCSNNVKVKLYMKHGLVSRTYSKKSLIMA